MKAVLVLLSEGDQVKQVKVQRGNVILILKISADRGEIIAPSLTWSWTSCPVSVGLSFLTSQRRGNSSTSLSFCLSGLQAVAHVISLWTGAWHRAANQCVAASSIIISSLVLWLCGFLNTRMHPENGKSAVCKQGVSFLLNFKAVC